jgi:hypothetical protein
MKDTRALLRSAVGRRALNGPLVSAPSEPAPVVEEKPEEKPKKDEEFAKRLQENKDKAEQTNRRLKGWNYVVSKYTVESVTKTRDELLKDKPKPASRYFSVVFITSCSVNTASIARGDYCISKAAGSMSAGARSLAPPPVALAS